MKWIIDCDPGCDDAIALALLAKRGRSDASVEVLTVAGNVGVDLTTYNTLRVLKACGRDWKVYRGCAASLSGEAVPAASVHGRDGLGDVPNNAFDIRSREPESDNALHRYVVAAKATNERFTLVCTGPLTNLASALNVMDFQEQKNFWGQCELCVVMGGTFKTYGNITASAEFNTHFDPVAAHIVLESWRAVSKVDDELEPIRFVPLDITEQVGIPLHNAGDASRSDDSSPAAGFLLAALRKYGLFHAEHCMRPKDSKGVVAFGIQEHNKDKYLEARVVGKSGLKYLGTFCYLHDPLAMWVALKSQEKRFKTWWPETNVTIDVTHGPGRGRLIRQPAEKVGEVRTRAEPLGTKVRWLDPAKFRAKDRKQFVADVQKLLGLAPSVTAKTT